MLQISSGKFYTSDRYYETPRSGTFYTNYGDIPEPGISTISGNLSQGEACDGVSSLRFAMVERIEWEDKRPGVMIATSGSELVSDFADVVAFSLNITCTTNLDLANRLLGRSEKDREVDRHSSKYLRRVFDLKVRASPSDATMLKEFLVALIGLSRQHYDGAIRAIRRYVVATHRISDDTSLAYALFVMAIEVLAQTTQTSVPEWADYDESKRQTVDEALKGAPSDVAESVRAAILANEHVAIGRRFREFAEDHLTQGFFREEAAGAVQPVGRPDLTCLLRRAYDIRSGYVHRLKEVPKLLTPPFSHAEVLQIEGNPTLTFQGLARLARHVIMQFVRTTPKVEREAFNWRSALPNILILEMAPQYWIGRPEEYSATTARRWFQAFLGQASAVLMRVPGATLTDLTAVLDQIESLSLGEFKAKDRRAMLALYHLFTVLAGPAHRRRQHEALLKRYEADFNKPSVEELAIHLVTEDAFPWSLDEVEQLHTTYYRERRFKNSLMIGEFLEAVFSLRCAELFRVGGNQARAREMVAFAVEAYPGTLGLRAFEANLPSGDIGPIVALEILLGPGTR